MLKEDYGYQMLAGILIDKDINKSRIQMQVQISI